MNRLRTLRKERGITQQRLALEIGTSQQTISRIESGASLIPIDLAINASLFFNISVDYLLGLTEEKRNQEICRRIQNRILNYEELTADLASLTPERQACVRLFIQGLKNEQAHAANPSRKL